MQVRSSSSERTVVNEVAGERPREEMGLTEPVYPTDIDIEDDETPDSLGFCNELVDLIPEDLVSNEENSCGKDQIHHEVMKENEIESEHQEDT
ncbi:hypothetical protein MKX01_018836 [Papaver californicum]|nr:hypothetical protein MKX01_018836 [Papaver californicum]